MIVTLIRHANQYTYRSEEVHIQQAQVFNLPFTLGQKGRPSLGHKSAMYKALVYPGSRSPKRSCSRLPESPPITRLGLNRALRQRRTPRCHCRPRLCSRSHTDHLGRMHQSTLVFFIVDCALRRCARQAGFACREPTIRLALRNDGDVFRGDADTRQEGDADTEKRDFGIDEDEYGIARVRDHEKADQKDDRSAR